MRFAYIFLIVLVTLAGVVSVGAQTKTTDDWRLVSYKFSVSVNAPIDSKEVTLTVDTKGGMVSGKSGCNLFTGKFGFDDSGRLKVDKLAGTMMACPDPWLSFEQQFLGTLSSADSFSFDGGVLTITDVETQNVLRFKPIAKPVVLTWYVNKKVVDCVGVVKSKCIQVKTDKSGEWQNLFGPIEGFEFKKDYFYLIEVERVKRVNPAADQPPFYHRLVRIIKQTKKESEL